MRPKRGMTTSAVVNGEITWAGKIIVIDGADNAQDLARSQGRIDRPTPRERIMTLPPEPRLAGGENLWRRNTS